MQGRGTGCGSVSLQGGGRERRQLRALRDYTPLVEHGIAVERSSNRLDHLLFAVEIFISPSTLPSVLCALIWSEQPGCCERKRGGRGLGTGLASLRSENASDTLLRRQLTRNQVLPCPCVPLYPCPLQTEVDRFWILIQNIERAGSDSAASAASESASSLSGSRLCARTLMKRVMRPSPLAC